MTTRSLDIGSASVSVPLTSQQGVALAEVPVSLHSEDNRLYATRWEDGGQTFKVELSGAATNGTLTSRGNQLLAVYVEFAPQRRIKARESDDAGRTWRNAVDLGAAPNGPALPTACLWQQGSTLRRAVAWSDQPSQSQGPLVTAVHDGNTWRAPVSNASAQSSGAALACADNEPPEVIWRDHRHGTGNAVALYQAQIDSATGATQTHRRVVQPGYDPSMCRSGTRRFVGFHTGTNDAHLAVGDATWRSLAEVDLDAATAGQQLDDSGKFVSVACAADTIAATWGDWPTKGDANLHVDATRRLGMIVSRDGGTTWQALQPAGSEGGQLVATVAVRDGRVAVLWRTSSSLRLVTYSWP